MPQEQNPIKWLLGFKETETEKAAREKREAQEKRSKEVIANAVRGGALPKNATAKPKPAEKKKQ
jgi:hypothetical protein